MAGLEMYQLSILIGQLFLQNDLTKYQDLTNPGSVSIITNYTWDFGDGDVLTGAAGGSVPGGTHGGRTIGTFRPQHNYVLNGTYSAKLTVDTNDGCNNSRTQSVFILPAGTTVTPLPSSPYSVDFESSNAGWIPEGLKSARLWLHLYSVRLAGVMEHLQAQQ